MLKSISAIRIVVAVASITAVTLLAMIFCQMRELQSEIALTDYNLMKSNAAYSKAELSQKMNVMDDHFENLKNELPNVVSACQDSLKADHALTDTVSSDLDDLIKKLDAINAQLSEQSR